MPSHIDASHDASPRITLRGKRILVEVLVANVAGAAFWRSVGFEPRYVGLQFQPGE